MVDETGMSRIVHIDAEADAVRHPGNNAFVDYIVQLPTNLDAQDGSVSNLRLNRQQTDLMPPPPTEQLCCHCGRKVLEIFWTCVTCENRIIICEDCDDKNYKCFGNAPGHDISHPLVRVYSGPIIATNNLISRPPSRSRSPNMRDVVPQTTEPPLTTMDFLGHQAVMDRRFTDRLTEFEDVITVQLAANLSAMQELHWSITRRIVATMLLAFVALMWWLLG